MPYKKNSQLPDSARGNLPEGAQDIFREAFDNAWEQYSDTEKRRGDASREETANRVAWPAVKKEYEKNQEGDWIKRS